MTDNTIIYINNTWNTFTWDIKSRIHKNIQGDYLIAALHMVELYLLANIFQQLLPVNSFHCCQNSTSMCNCRSECKYLGLNQKTTGMNLSGIMRKIKKTTCFNNPVNNIKC